MELYVPSPHSPLGNITQVSNPVLGSAQVAELFPVVYCS